ncbi:uncharacterized protein LOC142362050 [Opisthocomus hoazin]|uniref:uncharacterized protein LOC142362050 n=1 Tax=Opisthocomus hoazin TaxID=30419 RepID=UPI003F52B54C
MVSPPFAELGNTEPALEMKRGGISGHSLPDRVSSTVTPGCSSTSDTMAKFFAGLVYQAHFVGAELDEATRMRMQQLLVLLCELCWWFSRRSHQPASSSKHSGSRRLEKEEEEGSLHMDSFLDECTSWPLPNGKVACRVMENPAKELPCVCKSSPEEKEEGSLHMDSFLDEYTSWPVPKRKVACRVVENLAKELLRVCQKLSNNDFMPRLQAPVGLGSFQVMDPQGDKHYVYRLLVPLEPPPGHSFHLELSTEGEMPVRNSRLRVQLECTCREDRQPGDMLCFLHHSEDQPTSMQEASLLQTLCTGPYLDVQKTTLWLQELMKAACTLVPHTDTYKLTVLASRRYCRIKMTSIFKNSRSIELVLGMQHGDSDTFVCLK